MIRTSPKNRLKPFKMHLGVFYIAIQFEIYATGNFQKHCHWLANLGYVGLAKKCLEFHLWISVDQYCEHSWIIRGSFVDHLWMSVCYCRG